MTRHQRLIHSSSQGDEIEDEGNDTVRVQRNLRPEDSSFGAEDAQSLQTWPTAPGHTLSSQAVVGVPSSAVPSAGSAIHDNQDGATRAINASCPEVANGNGYVDNTGSFAMVDSLHDPMQDFTVFLESIGMSDNWFPDIPPSVESAPLPGDEPLESPLSHIQAAAPDVPNTGNGHNNFGARQLVPDEERLSNFGSRMPSLQPETRDDARDIPSPTIRPRSIRTIDAPDHQVFVKRLSEFQQVLPLGFVPPSTYSLSRFVDGFLDGLNQHLPFIHAPTLSIASCNPALTLALAACGSHYRFERTRGLRLFRAARAILLELLRRRGLFGPAVDSGVPGQASESPSLTSLVEGESEDRTEVIQILLLLTIYAIWSHDPEIMQEILSLQGALASIVRSHGLQETVSSRFTMDNSGSDRENWVRWARQERDRRTKLICYTFSNFCSTLHNTPPLLLSSDIGLDLPCSTDLWAAGDSTEWLSVYETVSDEPTSFQTSLTLLFSPAEDSSADSIPSTPLGNHVLLHAIFQQLYFARQLCWYPLLKQGSQLANLTTLEDALRSWKSRWKETRESSTNPRNPAGPIAFTSVALLGQAYVRLQVDLGPHRALSSNDPLQIAKALHAGPPIIRHPGLVAALLHAAHGLSIPIRLGVDFVARTYSFYWSVQHSLSALEYAFLLTRWLLVLPTVGPLGMSKHERKILLWIIRLMDETDMAVTTPDVGSGLDVVLDKSKMRRLSVGIARVWARTFQGNTCWGLVDLIGASLKIYADLLEASSG